MDFAYKTIRRVVIAIVGGTVLLTGIAMVVLPGPAVVVIPAGLAILAMEFAWAKHWLHKARDAVNRTRNSVCAQQPANSQSGEVHH
jgi:tellurite resistance protein TerC